MAGKVVNTCAYCCGVVVFTVVVFPLIGFCEDVLPYPIGLYPLNKLYNTGDASCYGNLGGIGKDVQLVTGPSGKSNTAYEFAGIGTSHITIPESPHLDAKNSITVLVWILQTGQAGSVIQYLDNNNKGVGLYTLDGNSVMVKFMERSGKSVSFLSNHTVSLQNKWQYVGTSYNYNTGTATLWIDGIDVQQMNLGKVELRTDRDIRIGSGQGNGDSFEGRISCLQIYDKALTRDEVSAIRNRCFQEDGLAPVDCKMSSAPSSCGVTMNTLSGTFYSPGYPAGYPHEAKCIWEIDVPDGYFITLQFSNFDLEIAYNKHSDCPDYVVIQDGINSWSDTLGILCGGQDGWGEEIVSSGNGLRVEFVSNKLNSAQGFKATYTASLIDDQVGKEQDEDMMDFSRHYTGIVIGVACAAIFAILSIITFSHTRRRLQERHNGSLTNGSRRHVPFSDNDIFQQNAPPTYDDVMRYPELYPPTPCHGSLANTPAATPRQGSPVSTPTVARRTLERHGSPMLIPKVGSPVGMPIFGTRQSTSSHSTRQSTSRVSLQRGISPLARAELTPQHSRNADHLSSDEADDDNDDELPPYPGIMGDTTSGNCMPRNGNIDSVLDQVRETLEQRRFVPRQGSNHSLSDSNSSGSNYHSTNIQSGSLALSSTVDNTRPGQARVEANTNSIFSVPSVGDSGYVNPWVSHKALRDVRSTGTLRSVESDV